MRQRRGLDKPRRRRPASTKRPLAAKANKFKTNPRGVVCDVSDVTPDACPAGVALLIETKTQSATTDNSGARLEIFPDPMANRPGRRANILYHMLPDPATVKDDAPAPDHGTGAPLRKNTSWQLYFSRPARRCQRKTNCTTCFYFLLDKQQKKEYNTITGQAVRVIDHGKGAQL